MGINDHTAMIVLIAFVLIFIKPVAAAVTLGSGGNGGVFGPALFVGAMSGFVFSFGLNSLQLAHLSEVNFIAAGMAGALSGVMQAPLTAIFLIAEITGGYTLFVPLMIVSAVAFFVSRYFEPHTLYKKRLINKGLIAGDDKDKWVLNHLKLTDVMETNFSELRVDMSLRELVAIIAHANRNIFPVLDPSRHLLGIVMLDDIREVMFQTEHYDSLMVKDLMTDPPGTVLKNEHVGAVMNKFEELDVWILPVLSRNRYVGFVSKSAVFGHYRQQLIKQSQDVA
jgi:CIC family chloride channel protein